MKFILLILLLSLISCKDTALYKSSAFRVYPDRVVQGRFMARAKSPTELISNYRSTQRFPVRRLITFKFSINGDDNERFPGEDHRIWLQTDGQGRMEAPLLRFGQSDPPGLLPDSIAQQAFLDHDVHLLIRLDMRHVLQAFQDSGAYLTPTGAEVKADEFKGVFIAGDTAPLSWNFPELSSNKEMQLTDADGDGIYQIELLFRQWQQEERTTDRRWQLQRDISKWPQFASSAPLAETLYNLSLEELSRDIRRDGAYMAGEKWPGVWTRDISYSILLSLAAIDPAGAQRSLLAKVKDGRIIQDTGTGGSWPVSTDRMTWALAAWEVYKVTGDRAWLKQSYEIIRRSVNDDLQTAFNSETNLFYGESSFLDWREQTYPRWMEPKDIYQSHSLGTNVVHFRTYRILNKMANLLGEFTNPYGAIADRLRASINQRFWQPDAGIYGQFLYGYRYPSLSPRSESLGASLAVLFNVTKVKQASRVVKDLPLTAYGPSCIYPQIPNIPAYHNNGVWPFVSAFYTWAAAKVQNEAAVKFGMASVYRAAALFATNKENMRADNGDYLGTEVNSDRQLWSVAGNLAMVYRVLFGMEFGADSLSFRPFVLRALGASHRLSHFRYHRSVLDIHVQGYGNRVSEIFLDGRPLPQARISAGLRGRHTLILRLDNREPAAGQIKLLANQTAPDTPQLNQKGDSLIWTPIKGARRYLLYRNGQRLLSTTATSWPLPKGQIFVKYQVLAMDARGNSSFLSRPVVLQKTRIAFPDGKGEFEVLDSEGQNRPHFSINIDQPGQYLIEAYYANGNGPVNTNNRCAIRTVKIDGRTAGKLVMPQRGKDAWSNYGKSSALTVPLQPGRHQLQLEMSAGDLNMNGIVNAARVRYLLLTRLK